LAVSKGYEFLSKMIFIDDELKQWKTSGNLKFVTKMELFLEDFFVSNVFLNLGASLLR